MNAVPEAVLSRQADVARKCYHCGDEIPARTRAIEVAVEAEQARHFCCEGCHTAYRIISAGGLESYYRHREEYGSRPEEGAADENVLYDLHEAKARPGPGGTIELTLRVEGIHCASCVWLNEKILNALPGVERAQVRLATERAYLVYDPERIRLREIAAHTRGVGYRLLPMDAREERVGGENRDLLTRMGVAGFFAGNMMLVSVALYAGYFDTMERVTRNLLHLVSFGFALPVVLYSARVFFRGAWNTLRHGVLGMDLLLSLGISLAFGYSMYAALLERGEVYFDSITFVVFAVLTGRFLEHRLRMRGIQQVENLRTVGARVVYVRDESGSNETPTLSSDVKAGQCLRVPPGETLPADGELLSERAELDESLLTGEFRPITRTRGDHLLSGSIAVGTAVLIRATHDYAESTLAKLHDLVEGGLRDSSPVDLLAARAARWFVGFVLLAGVCTLFFWWMQGDPTGGIHATIALLIVACPCALSLALPVARVVALQSALRNGCLIKNGAALDELATTQTIVLDKTGTLTGGRPRVTRVETMGMGDGFNAKDALALARALQNCAGARHPVAEAFRVAAGERHEPVAVPDLLRAEYVVGRGIRGVSEGAEYLLGSRAWVRASGMLDLESGHEEKLPGATPERSGDLLVYLACRASSPGRGERPFRLQAVFHLEDEIRPEAVDVIGRLSAALQPVLLTGDVSANARRVAGQLDIAEVHSESTPADKLSFIRARRESRRVCMVGDGINDAAALAAAHVGVSFADASEVSLYSADVLLLKNDLRQLVFLFDLARSMRRTMIRNLCLAFAYNAVLIPLACLGFIVPVLGAAFMALSSLTVVGNSLLLRAK